MPDVSSPPPALETLESLSESELLPNSVRAGTVLLEQSQLRRCHINLPGVPRPIGALIYQHDYYGYVKVFGDVDSAYRGAQRLRLRGNQVLITKVAKGFVLWVYEPEATLAT